MPHCPPPGYATDAHVLEWQEKTEILKQELEMLSLTRLLIYINYFSQLYFFTMVIHYNVVLIEPVSVYQVWLSRDLLSEFDVFERQ